MRQSLSSLVAWAHRRRNKPGKMLAITVFGNGACEVEMHNSITGGWYVIADGPTLYRALCAAKRDVKENDL